MAAASPDRLDLVGEHRGHAGGHAGGLVPPGIP